MPERNINNYSEEAQEILGRIPSWIIRWGITVIFAIFAVIVIGCCFIRYPERVNATVTVMTGSVPVDVVAKGSGNLEYIFVENNSRVNSGDVLGAIHTSSDYSDVLAVDSCLKRSVGSPVDSIISEGWIYSKYELGELQDAWTTFSYSCARYRDYLERNVIQKKKGLVNDQIIKQREHHGHLKRQLEVLREDYIYEEKNFRRDSSLFAANVISEQEYDESSRRLLQAHNAIMSFESQISSAELSIIQLEQRVVELSLQEDDETLAFEQEIKNSMERLSAGISAWKLAYQITSPVGGYVSFVRKWEEGQTIAAGEHFLTVVPDENQSVIGMVKIPQASFGKVEVGQRVNVRLDGYPYMEYGLLVAKIGYLSSVPEESGNSELGPQYTAELVFPDGMRSSYGKDLRLIQKMSGTAEIITEERSLIMRFIDPIVTLFENGM